MFPLHGEKYKIRCLLLLFVYLFFERSINMPLTADFLKKKKKKKITDILSEFTQGLSLTVFDLYIERVNAIFYGMTMQFRSLWI